MTRQQQQCQAGPVVTRTRTDQRRTPSRSWACASIAATALLAACGGGTSEQSSPSQSSQQAEPGAQRLSLASQNNTAATVSPMSPADPRWGTTSECSDSDYIAITGSIDYKAPLLSRHVACALQVTDPQPIFVWLMRNADNTGWEFYKRSAGREPSLVLAGHATLATQWQLYGEPKGLNKVHALRTSVKTWAPDASFPLSTSGLTIQLQPEVECKPYSVGAGITALPCNFSRPPTASLALSNGSTGGRNVVNIKFDWTRDSNSSSPDMASFTTALKSFTYTIQQTDVPVGQDKRSIAAAGSAGASFEQEIRCDKGLTTSGGSGCVMPAAAAVFVMNSASTDPASEAAIHVRNAQQAAQPGMTDRAPGVYAPLAGTRAVAEVRWETPYFPLYYTNDVVEQDANRKASCQSASSLYKNRPYVGSTSCPARDTAGCQCDEYPFASTTSGGATNPGTTSVRGVLGNHNREGGRQWQGFLQAQRVLPVQMANDAVWVFVK